MRFTDKITSYSFILTVFVIWMHAVYRGFDLAAASEIPSYALKAGYYIQEFLGEGLGQIAVPGFFCMSGYLFFRNKVPGREFYFSKWKKRFFTLVVPYLAWNLIYYVVYLICGRTGLSPAYLFDAVFLYGCNPVFWYMKELIVITIFTPVIYLCVKNKAAACISICAVFALAVFYNYLPFHIANEDACFYYMLGAALAVHLKEKIEGGDTGWLASFIFSLILAALSFTLLYNAGGLDAARATAFTILGRISGAVCVFSGLSLLGKFLSPDIKNCKFMHFNFLTYATHYLAIRFFRLIFYNTAGKIATETVIFVFMPFLCIAAAAIAGLVMQKYMPRLYGVLTGYRK